MTENFGKLVNSETDAALKLAIKSLIYQLGTNDQLIEYHHILTNRKKYDLHQKKYLQKQKLKKQLGADYQSSGSQDENNDYQGLSPYQYKCTIRQNLLNRNIDPNILTQIVNQISDYDICSNQNIKTNALNIGNANKNTQKTISRASNLNIIQQNSNIASQQTERKYYCSALSKKPLFGLRFLIDELQKIQKRKKTFVEKTN